MSNALREQWPWNPDFRHAIMVWSALLGMLITASMYSAWGVHALWWLILIPSGLIGGAIYAAVGRRVARLEKELSTRPGEVAEGLLFIGSLQAPGVVLCTDSALLLAPIAGKRMSVPLTDIQSLHKGSWLPGKYVWGKRVFTLTTPGHRRAVFAVTEPVARRWELRLKHPGTKRIDWSLSGQ